MLPNRFKLAVMSLGQPSIKKCIHMSAINMISPNNVTEIKIPVPWGHVAGKYLIYIIIMDFSMFLTFLYCHSGTIFFLVLGSSNIVTIIALLISNYCGLTI